MDISKLIIRNLEMNLETTQNICEQLDRRIVELKTILDDNNITYPDGEMHFI